ncbi:MAG: nucleotidyltransferase [Calditrichia bacterium]|nr:nucleotidyltransferase [Calditrichia bacterium]
MMNTNSPDNLLIEALHRMVIFLESQSIDYMVIGGIANSIYGRPRQTFDIDIKIAIEETQLADFIDVVSTIGTAVPDDPMAFIKETAVLPVDINHVRIDLILAKLPFEKEAIRHSVKKEIYGVLACVTRVEDLIIQKALSTREKDWMDIGEIIPVQAKNIDWDYLLSHIDQLSAFLADPSISERIRRLKNAE